jgi:hypothetical protein
VPKAESDNELLALIDATCKATQIAPGLLAWIEAAYDLGTESPTRAGRTEAAIPPEENVVSIDAAVAEKKTR